MGQRREDTCAALPRRQVLELLAAGDEHAEAVAAAAGEHAEGCQRCENYLALLPTGGAEVEAGRAVDDDEGVQLAVGLRRADVRLERTGREAPVDAARVVTRFVAACTRPLGTGADRSRDVVAGESAVETAAHLELQPAQRSRLRQQVGRAC